MPEPVAWKWLGMCAYEWALGRQMAAWETRRAGGSDRCLALEHPPTVTLGRRGTATELLVSPSELAHRGVAYHVVDRGGLATYHAPGQLVLYPIVHLGTRGLGVRTFVWLLEQLMLDVAAAVGVTARRDPRGTGIWTARGKLGAVGIRVRDGISTHGLALNVDCDLAGYGLIAPCGMRDLAVTSLRNEGADVDVAAVLPAAERSWTRIFDALGTHNAEARP